MNKKVDEEYLSGKDAPHFGLAMRFAELVTLVVNVILRVYAYAATQ